MKVSLLYWRPLLMVVLTAMMATATGPVTTTFTSATPASLMAPLSIPKTGASMYRFLSTAFKVPDMKPPRSVSLRIAQLRTPKVVCQTTKHDDVTVTRNANDSLRRKEIQRIGEKDGLPVYRGYWGPECPELNEADPDAPVGSPASRPYMKVLTGWRNGVQVWKTTRDTRKLIGYLNDLPLYVDAEIPEPQSALVSVGDGPAESDTSASNQPEENTSNADNADLPEGAIQRIGEQDGVPVYRANLGPEFDQGQGDVPGESQSSAPFKLVVEGYLRGRPVYQIARVWRKHLGYLNDLPFYADIVTSKFKSSAFVSADAHQDGPAESPASASNMPELIGYQKGFPLYRVHWGPEPHSAFVDAQFHHCPEPKLAGHLHGLPVYRISRDSKYYSALVSVQPPQDVAAESPASASNMPELIGYKDGSSIYRVHWGLEPHSAFVDAESHHCPEPKLAEHLHGFPVYRISRDSKYYSALVSAQPPQDGPAESPASCSHELEGNTSDDAEWSCQELVETAQEEPLDYLNLESNDDFPIL